MLTSEAAAVAAGEAIDGSEREVAYFRLHEEAGEANKMFRGAAIKLGLTTVDADPRRAIYGQPLLESVAGVPQTHMYSSILTSADHWQMVALAGVHAHSHGILWPGVLELIHSGTAVSRAAEPSAWMAVP